MDDDHYAHIVAMYMRSLFTSRLASVTGKSGGRKQPLTPTQIADDMAQTCHSAVDMTIQALLNIGMLSTAMFRKQKFI